jgi:nucleoside-diphosphate-sugar epimerase
MPRRVPDIAKINAAVGFRPTVTLDEILHTVIDYYGGRPAAAGGQA